MVQAKMKFNVDVESLLRLPNNLGVFWKDIEGNYLGCNDISAEKMNFGSRHDIVGRSDFDLPILHHEAARVREGDALVKQNRSVSQFHYQATLPDSKLEFITIKMPLFDADGHISGIFGIDNFIDKDSMNSVAPMLIDANVQINFLNSLKPKQYPAASRGELTLREKECLFYLRRGMTAKEIARPLGLSHRTVEHYIDKIKNKLGCRTRSELICAAIDMNICVQDIK